MKFEIVIPDMNSKQAEFLLDMIIRIVEFFGLSMAGGFNPVDEDETQEVDDG